MQEKIIQQGAEAILIQKSPSLLIKRRIKKSYRLPILDEKIRKQRTKKESSLLIKASALIPVPKIKKSFVASSGLLDAQDARTKNKKHLNIIKSDEKNKEIEMEFIEGKKLSESLDSLPNKKPICIQIGKQIALLHDNNIIHGDLTTSNIILSNKNNLLYFIDFGLGFTSNKIEDKAVDLHLIKQALEAKHFKIAKSCFESILEGYKSSPNSSQVLERLKKVESRGRYKEKY